MRIEDERVALVAGLLVGDPRLVGVLADLFGHARVHAGGRVGVGDVVHRAVGRRAGGGGGAVGIVQVGTTHDENLHKAWVSGPSARRGSLTAPLRAGSGTVTVAVR
jgi:hypothetical protein